MTLFLYVLRQLLISIGFSLAGIALLVLPTVAIQAVYKLGGVGMLAVLQYLPLVLAELVPYVLPMGFLLGVVATYGRLSADRELTAIRMAGIHPGKLLLPGLAIALPLCLGTYWLLATAAPQWKYAQRNFVRNAKEGAFRNFANARGEIEFGDFYMQYKSSEGNRFDEVMLNLPKTGGKELTLMADSVDLSFDRDSLVVGFANAFVLSDTVEFESSAPVVRLSLAELFPPSGGVRKRPKYQSTADLKETLRSAELKDAKREEIIYRIHERRALALTYVLFLLLGVPTGTMLRSGTQLGAITGAVGYAFLYYLLAMRLGKELAAAGAVPAVLAAWATTAVFLVAGIGLMLRALWR